MIGYCPVKWWNFDRVIPDFCVVSPEKLCPEDAVFRRAEIEAEDLPLARARHAQRDDGGLADHAAIDAHPVVRRVKPYVAMLADERPRPKRGNERIERAPPVTTRRACAPGRAVRSILGLAIVSTPPCVFLPLERTHGKMTDGRFDVYCCGLTELPPRAVTLPSCLPRHYFN